MSLALILMDTAPDALAVTKAANKMINIVPNVLAKPFLPTQEAKWLCLFVLAVFNVATFQFLGFIKSSGVLRAVLVEKQSVVILGGEGRSVDSVVQPLSYSRFAGLIGAVVMFTFSWALGNIVLFKLLLVPDGLKDLLDGIQYYLYGGATMFAPYGINKFTNLMKSIGSDPNGAKEPSL